MNTLTLSKLKKGDRIVFLGDSITAGGIWIKEIIQHFLDNYSELKIGFYNCGVPGGTAREVNLKNHMYSDCFNYFPKYVVIMFGMNDIVPWFYSPICDYKNKVNEREKCIVKYSNNMENIIFMCKQNNVNPILCTPTPYDQYNDPDNQNNWYSDMGIKICGEIVNEMAEKYNLTCIDMYSAVKEHIMEAPIKEDRVHPNEFGQHLMAEEFLYSIGAKENKNIYEIPFISPKNQARFEAEQKYRKLVFVEHNLMGWQLKPTRKLMYRKKNMRVRVEDKSDPIWSCVGDFDVLQKFYTDNADFKDEIQRELLKQTLRLYE